MKKPSTRPSLDEKTQAHLFVRHDLEELKPFSPENLQEVEKAFADRRGPNVSIALPPANCLIDFTGMQFDQEIDFSHYIFIDCSFKGADFSDEAYFRDATFLAGANFSGATFSFANFHSAIFSGAADFQNATFSGVAYFGGATFSGFVYFRGATFSDAAGFQAANFSNDAYFNPALFSDRANFYRATFAGKANFAMAIYSKATDFARATFSRQVRFEGVTFAASSTFVNAELKSLTSFEGTTFKTVPPEFFNAKLHQGTVWRDIKHWPKPNKKHEAEQFIDAYACLKLEMDRLKKHEDELDFFALELQSRRVQLGPWRGWPIGLYGVLSDYGRSYALPLLWLLVMAAFGAMLLVFSNALPIEESFGFSFANTLNVFGFRKDFFDAAAIECLPAPLKILSAVQTILGTILLFLFGLGVRNKFRMK